MNKLTVIIFASLAVMLTSCEKEIRNIANITEQTSDSTLTPIDIKPVDINTKGFELLEHMQGHWIGYNMVINNEYSWFAFDFRANSPSQIHGIYEGGTIGNLLTSFFVTDFKDTRTIMARNGGLLNGIYRSSYFVLDSVSSTADGDFYRLVDAEGSTNVMWMELMFKGDSLNFNAYTGQLGLSFPPTRHMTFKGKKENLFLAQAAATAVNFPQNIPTWDFSNEFTKSDFYLNQGDTAAKSASFLSQGNYDVETLAFMSRDPFIITDHEYLAYLDVTVVRNALINNQKLFVNLSIDPLTDTNGYLIEQNFNSILLFPELSETSNLLKFTYLHPGDYYITVIADANGDGYPSAGDVTHVSQLITISPEQQHNITIDNINIQN